LKETPDQPKALLLLARAHKFNGQIALADDFYARAFQASKNSPSYGMRYVQFLLKQGKQERAQTVLMDVVRKDPRNQNALTMLARLQIGNGDQRGAQATVDLLRKSNAQKAEELTAAIKADRPEAVDSGVAAMRSSYDATQTKEAMAALVKTYVKAGQKVEAQAFLETVLESSAANNDARLLLGQLHLLNGDYAGAEAAYRQMLVHEPINTQAYLSLAQLYERQQQSDQALQVLNEGLAAVPGDFNLSITKAGQLQRMGQVDEAISLYGALVEQRPDADVVVNNLASLLLDHKGDEESLKRANQLAKRFETSAIPHFRDTLGWSYFKLGDAVKAEPLLRSVVKALPSQAEFRYHLGMVLKANNDLEGARTELTKSLELLGEKSPSYRQYVEQALSEISG